MIEESPSPYEVHRARARAAITRQSRAEARVAEARVDRDEEILAMLATPGATLGSVAADVGLSKSMIAFIQRTARTTFESAEQARAFLAQHPDT